MINNRMFAGALLAATALGFAAPAAAQRIDRIVAFGDSYADDGNFFQLVGINPLTTSVYTTGRFSGGTNYIDTLGILLQVPIDNFAIGGALTDNRNTNGPPLGFVTGYSSFLGGGGPAAFPRVSGTVGPNDLLAVSVGGNDARFYQQTGGTLAGAPAAANASAAFATTGLNALVGAGARNISFLAGDTGRLPEIANNPAGAAIRSTFSTTFNSAVQTSLAGYAANGVIVHYLDLNRVLDNVTANFAAYGLTSLVCPPFPNQTCITGDSSPYLVYGDQLHLTSAGFAIVARYVQAQLTAPLTLQAPTEVALDTARQFGRTLTTRMDLGAPRDGGLPEGVGVYLVGDTISRTLGATNRNDQFKTTAVGLTGGVEFGFGSGMVGAALNVSRPKANFAHDLARDEVKSVQGGVYGGLGIAGGFVQAYAAIGRDRHDLTRQAVVSDMEADTRGRHSAAGLKLGYLMPTGVFRVGPVVALDHARARVNGYTEEGDSALTLNVDRQRFSSLRGSVGAEMRGDFGGNGVNVRPYAAAVLEKDFTGDDRTFTFAQTSAPGIVNRYRVEDASKKVYGRLSAGLSSGIVSGISVNATVSGTVAKDQGNETSGHVGLRAAF